MLEFNVVFYQSQQQEEQKDSKCREIFTTQMSEEISSDKKEIPAKGMPNSLAGLWKTSE